MLSSIPGVNYTNGWPCEFYEQPDFSEKSSVYQIKNYITETHVENKVNDVGCDVEKIYICESPKFI
jgi:hypothetical protein